MSDRPFRKPESHEAEAVTRGMLPSFLRDRGFVVERDYPERHGQTIVATSPEGEHLTMRVRLCWRREPGSRESERVRTFSAAQVIARIKNGDWIGSLQAKVDREKSRGVTHLLFVQRDDRDFKYAALVPLSELVPIWIDQRDISERLIKKGKLGRRKKNHAMNGVSPTLWLQDDRGGKEVADALWNHGGVRNLADLPRTATRKFVGDDSEAEAILRHLATQPSAAAQVELPEEVAEPTLYVEGACRQIAVNAYERDLKARRKCVEHYGTKCWVCGFSFAAVYGAEFEKLIHVHHRRPLSEIRGEYIVDPIKDLCPVCPNCHAVIHYGRRLRDISEVQQLLSSARQAKPSVSTLPAVVD
jgi:5-methylcytosine-specific restriction protein A